MAEEAQFPICEACAPYIERVYGDPSFGPAYVEFIGVSNVQQPRQQGGAFSFMLPDGAMPTDLATRMADFDLYCAFVGQRIWALRSIDTNDA